MGILGRPKQPRCKLCGSDRPLPFGEDTCDVCKRTCPACGRRVPYGGRGGARKLCYPCAELNVARLRCPCGRVFRKGLRRYCSVVCRRAALKIRAGGDAPANWNPDLPSIAKEEQLHVRAATLIAMWFRARYNYEGPANDVVAHGAAVWLKPRTLGCSRFAGHSSTSRNTAVCRNGYRSTTSRGSTRSTRRRRDTSW